MSRPLLRRLAVVAVITLWICPGVSAMAMGLHLASDHHADDRGDYDRSLAELFQVATHGHHHPVTHAPDHEHEARGNGSAPVFRPSTRLDADLPVVTLVAEQEERQGQPTPLLLHGPPGPLFTKSCSLLI